MTHGPSFTVGLVQMRSGLDPAANLDTAAKLIGEAKALGADYVQTPEMTNIMEIRRERLFAAIVPEEADRSLAAFRELAGFRSISMSARWRSSSRESVPPTAPF
jgi:predicted amidohydrolase